MTNAQPKHWPPAGRAAAGARSRRSRFLQWLRKTHAWIGLWGAALGLLFGSTGILLNHRTLLKIPAARTQETLLQLSLPSPAPADAAALADWLRRELRLERGASRIRSEPERALPWGDRTLKQPARWSAVFNSPRSSMQAEYWVGNHFVTIKRNDSNLFSTLNNLHVGNGVGVAWILLADTLAGSIVLLSLSGVLLWALLNRRRMLGCGICLAGLLAAIGLALQSM